MRRNRRPRCHTHTDTTHASARGLRTPPQDSGRSWAPGGPELRLQAWAVALLVSTSARKRARFIPSLGSGDLGPKPSLLIFFYISPLPTWELQQTPQGTVDAGSGSVAVLLQLLVELRRSPQHPSSPGPRGQADAGVLVSWSCLFLTRSLAAIRQPLPVPLSPWWGRLD